MHDLDLIVTLAGGLAAALAFGYVTQRLGLSPIVGYLLAGIAVGPATPGFVADRAMAEQLAELGIILLMFGVGLQFHFEELLAVRRIAIPGAVVQSLAATVLGAVVIHWLGWGWTAGVVYGLAISVASTVVLVRVLSDSGDLHTPTGHIAVGWLVMEDLFTVVVLVLLPLVFGSQATSPGGVAVELLLALLKIAAWWRSRSWWAAVLSRGCWGTWQRPVRGALHPHDPGGRAGHRSRLCHGLRRLHGARRFPGGHGGRPFRLQPPRGVGGAAHAGCVRGPSFVSVGMLFEPVALLKSPAIVLLTLVVVMIGKPLAAFGITAALGYPSRVACWRSRPSSARSGSFHSSWLRWGGNWASCPPPRPMDWWPWRSRPSP